MNVDYIVVGSGLAGLLFCHELLEHDKSFMVISDDSQRSSMVAGGLYNPVVLKRFTEVWRSHEQIALVNSEYNKLERRLQVTLDQKLPVYRMFASIEEQNNWFQASDKPVLRSYMSPTIEHIDNPYIKASYGFGKVNQTGRIDTELLIQTFKHYLIDKDQFLDSTFQYDQLEIDDKKMRYQNIEAKHIVFAEGFGLKKNPFFKHLPLKGTKGELLTIDAPLLNIDFVLKSSAFIIPLGEHTYRVGATYEWTDKSHTVTQEARDELLNKLYTMINCKFKVLDQVAGIRPTVIDRRPLVGRHEHHKNLFVLNGLGTRGVMIAPFVAKQLFNYIENGTELVPEINCLRFS